MADNVPPPPPPMSAMEDRLGKQLKKQITPGFKMLSLPEEGIVLKSVKKGQLGGVVVHQVRNATVPLTRPLEEDRPVEPMAPVVQAPPPVITPPPTVFCAGCNGPITTSDWVQALNKNWHPDHFTCKWCNLILGKDYYVSSDGKYAECKSCYYKHDMKCARCGKMVGDKFMTEDGEDGYQRKFHPECYSHKCNKCMKAILADCSVGYGKYYHPNCFTCVRCNKALQSNFVDNRGEPYCFECGVPKELIGKACNTCKNNIDPFKDTVVICDDRIWHNPCFACTKCNKLLSQVATDLGNGRKISCVETGDGKIVCDPCFYGENGNQPSSSSNVCDQCQQVLRGRFLTWNGKKIHPECHICSFCSQQLTGQFYQQDGKKICAQCSMKCVSCGKAFTNGKHVTARTKHYHPECFKCAVCSKVLSDDFFVVGEQFMCDKCSRFK